jgi:hypothetical protein
VGVVALEVASVEAAGSVVVAESAEVVASVDVPVASELVEDVPLVSFELEVVPVIAATTENGTPSASAPDAITPRRSRPIKPAATFAHHSRFDLLVRSEPLPAATTFSPFINPMPWSGAAQDDASSHRLPHVTHVCRRLLPFNPPVRLLSRPRNAAGDGHTCR